MTPAPINIFRDQFTRHQFADIARKIRDRRLEWRWWLGFIPVPRPYTSLERLMARHFVSVIEAWDETDRRRKEREAKAALKAVQRG